MDPENRDQDKPALPRDDQSQPPVDSRAPESLETQPREGDQHDDRSDAAYDFLSEVLDLMQMDVTVKRRRPRKDSNADEIRLEIVGRDAGRVIGKKGQVLTALQYLVSRAINRPGFPRRHIVLDAEGYRERREASLAQMARKLGQQAATEGKIITFEPMSPRDRRVVHLALADFTAVVTRSDGEGEERRVRIIPVRK